MNFRTLKYRSRATHAECGVITCRQLEQWLVGFIFTVFCALRMHLPYPIPFSCADCVSIYRVLYPGRVANVRTTLQTRITYYIQRTERAKLKTPRGNIILCGQAGDKAFYVVWNSKTKQNRNSGRRLTGYNKSKHATVSRAVSKRR